MTIQYKNLNVAISYNSEVGGESVLSVKNTLGSLGVNPIDADYRKILPKFDPNNEVSKKLYDPMENIEEIFSDQNKFNKIMKIAKKRADDFLEKKDIDLIILPGNTAMIDPRLYGDAKDPDKLIDIERSLSEIALLHHAVQKGIPVLGICGGFQLINTYFGGTIKELTIADLREQRPKNYSPITFNTESILGQIFKHSSDCETQIFTIEDTFFGHHYECIDKIGGKNMIIDHSNKDNKETYISYFNAVACSMGDNNIEAIESINGLITGIQFHPEIGVKGFANDKLYTLTDNNKKALNLAVFELKLNQAYSYSRRKLYHKRLKELSQLANLDQLTNAESLNLKEHIYQMEIGNYPDIDSEKSSIDETRTFTKKIKEVITTLAKKVKKHTSPLTKPISSFIEKIKKYKMNEASEQIIENKKQTNTKHSIFFHKQEASGITHVQLLNEISVENNPPIDTVNPITKETSNKNLISPRTQQNFRDKLKKPDLTINTKDKSKEPFNLTPPDEINIGLLDLTPTTEVKTPVYSPSSISHSTFINATSPRTPVRAF